MSDITEPPTPPAAGEDNSTIREMRARIEALAKGAEEARTAQAAAEAKLTEIERAKLDENARLKLELEDERKKAGLADQLRDEHGRYVSAFEQLYRSELDAVTEAARPIVEGLSKSGTWPERMEALRAAKALLAGAPPSPAQGGSVTKPGGSTPPPPAAPEPKPFDWKNPPGWGEVLKPIQKT